MAGEGGTDQCSYRIESEDVGLERWGKAEELMKLAEKVVLLWPGYMAVSWHDMRVLGRGGVRVGEGGEKG